MNESRPFIVGIAGGSCSGKTTLAKALLKKYQQFASLIMFDDYFIDPGDVNLQEIDWESIDRYDIKRLRNDLSQLKSGETIVYASNSRESSEEGIQSKTIEPKPLIIVEGFLLFADLQVRNHLNLTIFLDVPEQEIVKRRLARKIGNSPWDAEDYIYNKLLKGHRDYVLPSKVFAGHVIDATKSQDNVTDQIDALITSNKNLQTKIADRR